MVELSRGTEILCISRDNFLNTHSIEDPSDSSIVTLCSLSSSLLSMFRQELFLKMSVISALEEMDSESTNRDEAMLYLTSFLMEPYVDNEKLQLLFDTMDANFPRSDLPGSPWTV